MFVSSVSVIPQSRVGTRVDGMTKAHKDYIINRVFVYRVIDILCQASQGQNTYQENTQITCPKK